MIRIEKSNIIPEVLVKQGAKETKRLCTEYERNPELYSSTGKANDRKVKRFEFDNKIYGHTTVKQQLIKDQKEKCCFCESRITANSYGDVEHFRPKAAYKKDNKLVSPGYYWLAYSWDNLLFSCEMCNRKFKKNEFPLINEISRVKNHKENNLLESETHVLINPVKENPEEFIYFEQYEIKAKNDNIRGKESIKSYGLDRKELNNERREHLQYLKIFMKLVHVNLEDKRQIETAVKMFQISESEFITMVKSAKRIIENAAKNEAKFAGMVRANFPELEY